MVNIISLGEARHLREQLRPAFAGYVTDGDISDRDVLATLLDLIVREKIGLDADLLSHPVHIRHVDYLGDFKGLLPFESEFIRVLFKKSKSLSARDVKRRINSRELHAVIENNLDAIREYAIVASRLELLDKNRRRLPVKLYKDGYDVGEVTSAAGLRRYRSELAKNLIVCFVLSAGGAWMLYLLLKIVDKNTAAQLLSSPLGLLITLLLMLPTFFFIIPAFWAFRDLRRHLSIKSRLLAVNFGDNLVPYVKHKYEELLEFIQQYPLKEQRIYNEFMPHAVAFGLDTSWNSSFYIPTEYVIRSSVARSPKIGSTLSEQGITLKRAVRGKELSILGIILICYVLFFIYVMLRAIL